MYSCRSVVVTLTALEAISMLTACGLVKKKRSNGFTILEVAIVLVVIGLLLGAMLGGQQLISGAQTNRAVAQMSDLTTAYLTYIDRYGAVPGDDSQASTRWPQAKDGTGDRLISGRFDDSPPSDPATLVVNGSRGENLNFWWHLRLAGLITGSSNNPSPAAPLNHPFGGRAGIQQDAYGVRGAALCMENVPGSIASAMDVRLDDERPDTGSVRAAPQSGGVPPAAYPGTNEPYILCGGIAARSGGPALALIVPADGGAGGGTGDAGAGDGSGGGWDGGGDWGGGWDGGGDWGGGWGGGGDWGGGWAGGGGGDGDD
jgi:prepilin-type N-terminal cleavage/methylation domain-containing protein